MTLNLVKKAILLFFVSSSLFCFGNTVEDSTKSVNLSRWAFDVLNIPSLKISKDQPIVVAVIDDGFLLSHNSLKDFIFVNENEVPGNSVDDDKNGFIDDYQGWDVSDNDHDVNIRRSDSETLYHGTFVASLITQIASASFGDQASDHIRILPVKAIADQAETTAILDGYAGIKYATSMGADIICTSWSGGSPSRNEIQIINDALSKEILIIGSAGNTNREKVDFPASITGVYTIAAIDMAFHRTEDSNYGMDIDLALPGERVRAAHPDAVNAWFYGRGTSAAAGLATGCAAILKVLVPGASPALVFKSLKNTAIPIDSINNSFCGKLGAGIPDLAKAVNYLQKPGERHQYFNPLRPEGTISIQNNNDKNSWEIRPWGAYHSITITPDGINKQDEKKSIQFYKNEALVESNTLKEIAGGLTIDGSMVTIKFDSNRKRDLPRDLKLNYFVETIDSSRLYCRDEIHIEKDKGMINDKSQNENYANNCNCLWKIHAPNSEKIHFSFTAFDTEAKVDFVWLFDGNSTHPDNIIAKFSGPEIPPEVTSRTNMVTVWFVTDSKQTAGGWELHFDGK